MTHRPETDGTWRTFTHGGDPAPRRATEPRPDSPHRERPWEGVPRRARAPWPPSPSGGGAPWPPPAPAPASDGGASSPSALQANRFSVRRRWTVSPAAPGAGDRNAPVVPAAGVARPPADTLALDVMPYEIRVGDWLPFSDQVARRVVDLRAVGPGNAYRRVDVGDVPALTVTRRVRVYRDVARVERPGRGRGGAAAT
ncbi:hypothetical protein AB0H29_31975 [Streptomyces thermolilacinus]